MKLPRTRRLQRFATWIATFAIVLAALAPTVSQALVASGLAGSGWIEVCTARGTLWVAIGEDASSEAPAVQRAGMCAYCFTHAGSFGLAPCTIVSIVLHEEHRFQVLVFPSDPIRVASVWSPHQTRAPPLSA